MLFTLLLKKQLRPAKLVKTPESVLQDQDSLLDDSPQGQNSNSTVLTSDGLEERLLRPDEGRNSIQHED